MSDVNLDGLERDEAIFTGPACANCGGIRLGLVDGWCQPCLRIGRWSPNYRRPDYRWQITVPGSAVLCGCFRGGGKHHVHGEPAVYKFLTRLGADEAARVYSQLAKQHIQAEEIP